MTWIAILSLVVVGLALLPVFLMARAVDIRSKRMPFYRPMFFNNRADDVVRGSYLASDSETSFTRAFNLLEGEGLSDKVSEDWQEPTPVTQEQRQDGPFEYTIRRQKGASWQFAANMGGFAEVSLLLHDRFGNSFTVFRRLSLN